MIRPVLALALVLSLLSSCLSPNNQAPVAIGNCRPDIGPGGVLKVLFETKYTDVALMKTPLESYTIDIATKQDLSDKKELVDWTKYTLKVDFASDPPKAALYYGGTLYLDGFSTQRAPPNTVGTISLSPNALITQNTLTVFTKNPTGSEVYKTTAYLARR